MYSSLLSKQYYFCYHNFIVFIFTFSLFLELNGSVLEIIDHSSRDVSISSDVVSLPHFDLGNRDFPVSGSTIFAKGCTGIDDISDEQAFSVMSSSNSTKLIVLKQYDVNDASCFGLSYIFSCQKREWCGGVIKEDIFFNPTGMEMWSLFDKHRPRSDYKVPLAQMRSEDFIRFQLSIIESKKFNRTHRITLTNDPNPWETMFTSTAFLIYFRILTPLWSLLCFIFINVILWKQYRRAELRSTQQHQHQQQQQQLRRSFSRPSRFKLTLKRICLLFHAISHISRIFLSVDPFSSQQIYPYLVMQLMVALSLAFDIATNILLSFVIRELTQVNKAVDMMKRVKLGYTVVGIFLILDFVITVLQGLLINPTPFPIFYIIVFFYVVVNIILGIWYLTQAYQFLKYHAEHERVINKKNPARVLLTQISVIASIGIILFGVLMMLFAVRGIYGNPWGYFISFASLVAVVQITSIFEILLFAGISINVKAVNTYVKKSLLAIQHSISVTDETVHI